MAIIDRTGVVYHPLADRWQRSKDMDVNYMVLAEKARSDPYGTAPATTQLRSSGKTGIGMKETPSSARPFASSSVASP